MAISKAMLAALRLITALEPDVKKSYKMKRQLETLSARLLGKPTDYHMWDQIVFCDDRAVPVRMFTPEGEPARHMLLYLHGGGWVTGGIGNYTGVCADLAKATGCAVALVDYRLAPEHKFPAAPEDCYAIAREFFLRGALGVPPENITLIGDSAGGNLAAAVSLMAHDRGEFMPPRQILIYPSVWNDHSETSPFPSVRENGTGYLLSSKRIMSMIDMYKFCDEDLQNPYFAPLLAEDLSHQPRTLIITAEFCPLRDEGAEYGRRLSEAGVEARVEMLHDALHAFMMLPPTFEHVQLAYQLINDFLTEKETPDEKQQKLEQA